MTTISMTDTLAPLALTPERDVIHDRYSARLCESVPRVTRRIGAMAGPAVARELDAWREVFQSLPDEVARKTVADPFFNYYWLQLMDGCLEQDVAFLTNWAADFARFLVVPAARCGIAAPTEVALRAGDTRLRMPGELCYLQLGANSSGVRIEVRDGGDGALRNGGISVDPKFLLGSAGTPDRLADVRRLSYPRIAGTGIRIDAEDPWLRRLFDSMNLKTPLPGYPAADLSPMLELAVEQHLGINRSFELIEQVWPELAAELRAYVTLFVPYSSSHHSSFTEACMMGAVFQSEAMWPFTSVQYTAEHLLHEEAHLRLTLIEEVDPLVTAETDSRYDSPWRKDPRPLSGLVQAAFAFARIAAFHRRAYVATGDPVHERRHAEVVQLLAAGLREVENGPRLIFTEAGERLWAEMAAETR